MGSPFLMPKSRIVFLAFRLQGLCCVSCSRTFAAFSRGYPDFPTDMLTVTFSILGLSMGFPCHLSRVSSSDKSFSLRKGYAGLSVADDEDKV